MLFTNIKSRPSARRPARRGAVALELAIVAVPFLVATLGTMELGYDMYVQEALDSAVETTAREVQVGSVHGMAGESSSTFVADAVCGHLHTVLDCNQIIVAVKPLPAGGNDPVANDYYTLGKGFLVTLRQAAAARGSICTGHAQQLMLLQAWYIGPTFVGALIPGFATPYPNKGGPLQHITESAAGFVNEFNITAQHNGVGC